MKRILIAGAFALAAGGQALAADLPQPAPPPPRAPATYVPAPVPYYNWGGIYFGINGGYGFGTITPTGVTSFSPNGFLFGGTLGANWQASAFVFGVEGDLDYSSVQGTTPACAGCTFKSTWISTARGRAGYAFDRILVYATGGGAFGGFSGPGSSTNPAGWTAGGGIEAAFAPNWTAKAEYLYVDFGNPTLSTLPGVSFKFTESLIRLGVNYKFSF